MAWASCVCRGIFSRCVPGPRLTSLLRPATRRTSWTSTARNRLPGALVSSWRTTTRRACHVATYHDGDYSGAMKGGQTLVKAVVGVMVVCCDGEPPHDVYGTVTATTTTAASGEPPLQYSLFHRVKGEPVCVPEGTAAIPLQREHVPAPLRSQLTVSARLRCLDQGCYYGGDDEIADGSVVFTPSLDGTDGAVIRGRHGMVRVDVAWSSI